MTMIIFGSPFTRTVRATLHSAYVYEGYAFPQAWVTTDIWDPCALCGLRHAMWLCDDRVWADVPRLWQNRRLCRPCARVLILHHRALRKAERPSRGALMAAILHPGWGRG